VVTPRPLKNVTDSVRQRLLNQARESGRPFGELLQYYAMERFLYRMSQSSYADKFVLKGAMMLVAWKAPVTRPTKDIDLLGRTANDVEAIAVAVSEICKQEVEDDGIAFDAATVTADEIVEEADYHGVRVQFRGQLGTARISMQIDIGFGDIVVPSPQATDYPTILDQPKPRVLVYSRESTVAEKLEAMVRLGAVNSRMKDFFDILLLSRWFDFDGRSVAQAIRTTFANRNTEIPAQPLALTHAFLEEQAKQAQWEGFVRKSRLDNAPSRLEEVVEAIGTFLLPITGALAMGDDFEGTWSAPGPWKTLR
jgi:predicted nucleotidyltransferase component of viral defense system